MSTAQYQKEWRARHGANTGVIGRPRLYEGCGSPAAYSRHVRKGETIDDACRQAWSTYQKGRRAIRKAETAKAEAALKAKRSVASKKAAATRAAKAKAKSNGKATT